MTQGGRRGEMGLGAPLGPRVLASPRRGGGEPPSWGQMLPFAEDRPTALPGGRAAGKGPLGDGRAVLVLDTRFQPSSMPAALATLTRCCPPARTPSQAGAFPAALQGSPGGHTVNQSPFQTLTECFFLITRHV